MFSIVALKGFVKTQQLTAAGTQRCLLSDSPSSLLLAEVTAQVSAKKVDKIRAEVMRTLIMCLSNDSKAFTSPPPLPLLISAERAEMSHTAPRCWSLSL